jgi:DNA polymerase-1
MGITLKAFMDLEKTNNDLYELKRFHAKAVNFGFIYGMSADGFMVYAKTQYGIDYTLEESQAIRNAFFKRYPRLLEWHEKVRRDVARQGYVRAAHGALRHLPNVRSSDKAIVSLSERQAINSPIQRFSSDLGLIAMVRMCRDMPKDNSIGFRGFVHDCLIVEVKKEQAEQAASYLRFYMENPPLQKWFNTSLPIPLVADVKYGENLADLKKLKVQPAKPEWFTEEADNENPIQHLYNVI